MSDPQPNVMPMQQKLKAGQAFLSGLVAGRRLLTTTTGKIWLTVVKLPAPDEFSHPGTIEVRSQVAIGEKGDKWSGVVMVSGYPRNYNSKPDENGEVKLIQSAQNQFDVVEA